MSKQSLRVKEQLYWFILKAARCDYKRQQITEDRKTKVEKK